MQQRPCDGPPPVQIDAADLQAVCTNARGRTLLLVDKAGRVVGVQPTPPSNVVEMPGVAWARADAAIGRQVGTDGVRARSDKFREL